MTLFHEPKLIQKVHAPGLKGLTWGTTSRRNNQGLKSKQKHGCCTNPQVGPEWK